eukprot:UN1220
MLGGGPTSASSSSAFEPLLQSLTGSGASPDVAEPSTTPALEELLAKLDADEVVEPRAELVRLCDINQDVDAPPGTVGASSSEGTFSATGTVTKLLKMMDPVQLEAIQMMQAEADMDDEHFKQWRPCSSEEENQRFAEGTSGPGSSLPSRPDAACGRHQAIHRHIAKWGGHHRAAAIPRRRATADAKRPGLDSVQK